MSESGKTVGEKRDRKGRFVSGSKGGPGRRKGVGNTLTEQAKALLESEGQAIVKATIRAAKEGDTTAQRLILDRLLPPRRFDTCTLGVGEVSTERDIAGAAIAITTKAANGELDPVTAKAFMDLLLAQAELTSLAGIEERLQYLETQLSRQADA